MRKTTALLSGIAFCAVCSVAYGLYEVANEGTWPASWPKELEPLRSQAQTHVGPLGQQSYLIPFTKRDQFEAAWSHLVKVKSKGAPIILVRAPKTDFMSIKPAGVIIHSPAEGPRQPQEPLPGDWVKDVRDRWVLTTYIELVVDGNIVDMNRIPLPTDTPIIDERFPAPPATAPKSGGE